MPRLHSDMEKKTVKKMGGRATINSGASLQDGDARRVLAKPIGFYNFRGIFMEIKSTLKKQFPIKLDILEKARLQAHPNRDLPVVVIDFGKKRYVVLDENDFTDIIDFIAERVVMTP